MESLSEKVEVLQNLLISVATGGGADVNYSQLREEVVNNPVL